MAEQETDTVIRIAGIDIPIHLAWDKIEVLNTSADVLEQLNEKYPHLATEFSHEIIPLLRKRLTDCIGDVKPPPAKEAHLVEYLTEKLEADVDPLDIIELAQKEKDVEMTLEDLVYLVGEEAYMAAMTRQAMIFHENKLSPEQVSSLWNEAHYPAPGKQHWTKKDIMKMIGIDESSGWD